MSTVVCSLRWAVRRAQFAAVGEEVRRAAERGHRDRGEFEPVLERLHERDRPHAAADHVRDDDSADRDAPTQTGTPEQDLQRQSGALELRDQVQRADDDDDDHRERAQPAEPSRNSAKSGTVYAPERRSGAATNSSSPR